MTNADFGVLTTAYKALTTEGIETMGRFLPVEAKMFSNDNLDKNGSQGLITGEVLKLQNLWMWAYCRRSTHENRDNINWSVTKEDLDSWVIQEGSLILKI